MDWLHLLTFDPQAPFLLLSLCLPLSLSLSLWFWVFSQDAKIVKWTSQVVEDVLQKLHYKKHITTHVRQDRNEQIAR